MIKLVVTGYKLYMLDEQSESHIGRNASSNRPRPRSMKQANAMSIALGKVMRLVGTEPQATHASLYLKGLIKAMYT